MRFAAILISVALILGGIFILRSYNKTTENLQKPFVFKINSTPVVSSSPIPFFEMTIPYLKGREYKSKLGELKVYSENSNYTSYLTSYSSDDLKIYGLLTKPTGEMPMGGWPTLIFVHGYIPPTLYQTTEKYVEYVDFLAKNGFVVFKIDLRGHGDSEGDPGGAYYSPDYIIDVLNAYSALEAEDFVGKIGLWGHSMAGNVVVRSLAGKPQIPAVVIWAGAVYSYEDFVKYRLSDNSYRPPELSSQRQKRRQELFSAHGEFNKNNVFWKQVAPTNYLEDIKGAIQIHHAINDDVVNIGYSRDLIKLLDQTSISHELFEYQSGGHNIIGSSFTTAMTRTVEFFKKYLQ